MKKLLLVVSAVASATAFANPRALPFTYPSESLSEGSIEFEQFVDMTPVTASGLEGEPLQPLATLTTEMEYGITNALELGLYLQFKSDPSDGAGFTPFTLDGVKQRLRYRLADPGTWPVDVALYGEVAELHDELELEGKVILQRRFGPFRVATNLVLEHEFAYDGEREWKLAPTLGMTWEPRPSFSLGLEGFMNAAFPVGEEEEEVEGAVDFNDQPHFFVGPAAMWQWKRLWVSGGAYVRLDEMNRAAQPGDHFGKLWVRTIVGLNI